MFPHLSVHRGSHDEVLVLYVPSASHASLTSHKGSRRRSRWVRRGVCVCAQYLHGSSLKALHPRIPALPGGILAKQALLRARPSIGGRRKWPMILYAFRKSKPSCFLDYRIFQQFSRYHSTGRTAKMPALPAPRGDTLRLILLVTEIPSYGCAKLTLLVKSRSW